MNHKLLNIDYRGKAGSYCQAADVAWSLFLAHPLKLCVSFLYEINNLSTLHSYIQDEFIFLNPIRANEEDFNIMAR